jgi:hypothetical protein
MKKLFIPLFFLSTLNSLSFAEEISARRFAAIAAASPTLGECTLTSRYTRAYPCGRGDECGDRVNVEIVHKGLSLRWDFSESENFSLDEATGLYAVQIRLEDALSERHCIERNFPQHQEKCRHLSPLVNRNLLTIHFNEQKIRSVSFSFAGEEEHRRSYEEFRCE